MNISDFDKCSNCGACYNICPCNAVSVNKNGVFYDLAVDPDRCVDCGLCSKVCPVNNKTENNKAKYAYAGWHNDREVVKNSSSGGTFFGLAQKVIEENGVVFAAEYSSDCKEVFFSSTDETQLGSLMKSKYVESLVGFSFREIREELEKNRKVLFCGTPCQVAGLISFLKKGYQNLITCDFACGGLPSHEIYREYIEALEQKYCSRAKKVDFRPKTHGWKRYAVKVDFENGKTYNRLGTEDKYLKSFLYGKYTVRDYCLECKFSENHYSDITIADFWLHKKLSDLSGDKGISLILCNTEKGNDMIYSIKDNYVLTELDVGQAAYNNKKTETSEQKMKKHDDFISVYREKNLSEAYKSVFKDSFKDKIKDLIIRKINYKRKV